MKKLIFAVMAVMVMAAPMANAQKVNKDATLAKLAKADADVADAKKGSKAATLYGSFGSDEGYLRGYASGGSGVGARQG